LSYEQFIDEAAMECEVHELCLSEQGLIEHNPHIMEARASGRDPCPIVR